MDDGEARTQVTSTKARLDRPGILVLLWIGSMLLLAALGSSVEPTHAQACPPHCSTPIVTPAWHLHMCDVPYQEQLDDNRCMIGDGITEFPDGTDRVYIIYCHRADDLVVVQVRDAGGGLQYVNHPDGITYPGNACESLVFSKRNGIAPAGSPYYTSAYWPEGPFHGVSRGIAWYIGLYIAFDQDAYYGGQAEAFITARDPGAVLNPAAFETITARVTSDSDPEGIAVTLRQEAPSFSIFRTERPLKFSPVASDEAAGVIKVANRDTVTVSYCPRNCARPYTDTATWYQLVATVTPTGLPTWPGPAPTATATPPPDVRIEYITLRPAPDDVGYASEITNRGLPNHLGYPSVYSGMWTRGRNRHFGMVQFDLSDVPSGVSFVDARLQMVGRDKAFTDPGAWSVQMLDAAIDVPWRSATFGQVAEAGVVAQIGPTLSDADLAAGRTNAFGFSAGQLAFLNQRLTTTRRVSFRVDGPPGPDENLFAWHSGVDKYRRESVPPDPSLGPSLALAYVLGAAPAPPVTPTSDAGTAGAPTTPAAPPGATISATPSATATVAGGDLTATALPSPSTPDVPPPVTPTADGPVTAVPATPTADGSAEPSPPGPEPTAGGTPVTGTPPGWGTATPDAPPTTRTATATATGPAEQRQVCLVAFDDQDGDGTLSPGERFLPDVTVKLTHTASGAFVSWTTDGRNEPDFCWSGLADGSYTIAVVASPFGFVPSGPTRYAFDVPFPGLPAVFAFALRRPGTPTPTPPLTSTPTAPGPFPSLTPEMPPAPSVTPTPSITPTPTDQPTVTGPSGEICMAAFDDVDGDGYRGVGEAFLRAVSVTIRDVDRRAVRELSTLDHALTCSRLAVGVYFVAVAPPAGRVATGSGEVAVLLTDRQRQIVEFGLVAVVPAPGLYVPYAER